MMYILKNLLPRGKKGLNLKLSIIHVKILISSFQLKLFGRRKNLIFNNKFFATIYFKRGRDYEFVLLNLMCLNMVSIFYFD